jgi:hypothetical protein
MAKYRKKPLEVDAEQFHANQLPRNPLVKRCVLKPDGSVDCILAELERFQGGGNRTEALAINTRSGWSIIKDGDWIIREDDGKGHYPCSNEVFQRTYEANV